MNNLPRKLGILVMVVIAVALWIGIGSVIDRKEEQRGRAASETATEKYREEFPVGTSIADVKAKLEKSQVSTLIRGDQYVLAIVGRGVAPWYCDTKYLGAIFEFRNGGLTKLNSGEMLGRCL